MHSFDRADQFAHEGRLMIREIGTDISTVTVGRAVQFTQGIEHQFKALALYGGQTFSPNHEVLCLAQHLSLAPDISDRFAWIAATAERSRQKIAFPGTAPYESHIREVARSFWSWAEEQAGVLAVFTENVGRYARGLGPAPAGWRG